ncbi:MULTISPECIES: site-specific DNA-methyltransferase [Klebsiella pneumoniae complex]|uniref:site-specific DNA-methyltransferase n=1 Tax=Klebsiella pneumoniae complex TaxID=3390273 RepID=UPI000A3A6A98|nr:MULTISPECIES: site-specific DNA-methyltransferase [Klebsiella]HDS2516009.1 site-specific DNA-methyltransferase [Klebsiella pneumoniae subsp. pneumoniae]EIX9330388.1 site-specific DNA-methyltransferase [Klebsiella pneumoniae]EKX4253368.1 site-specific DNA-methyltransferase [Klebsiella pneumoniae]EKX7968903.1 site-specific DNA-methyltransferase [Klebsiella pneumoniae]MBV0449659.1 site-specific DNA-methyltransferase [Klebsiella quasipneumoniae]
MSTKQKLELNWIGKQKRPRLEPRILLEDKSLSYGDADSENLLIHGDNLLALKALEQKYAGKVKCIFIDPPYNTGSAFKYYEDGLEHSVWLCLIRDRLEILRTLLSEDGSIWITIDDNEAHYLKIVCDEVFGRNNFQCDIAWEKRYAPPPDTKGFGYVHDHLLCYRKSEQFQRNYLPMTEDQTGRYKNPDNDPRGPWKSENYTCRYTADERPNLYYPIINPHTGEEIWPSKTRVWAMSRGVTESNLRENRIWWGKNGANSKPALKNFLSEVNKGMMPMSIWKHTLAGHTQEAMKEMLALYGDEPFTTPKPERLLQTILTIATNKGDLVLDSFAGSGTTGAVAHKMDRRWIMVELGEHCNTHIVPRLKKVISGEDLGGISKSVNWQGGGGFRYFHLAPSLLKKDNWGNWVINKEYNAEMLAEAMCKHMNFTYAPSQTQYWNHGYSTETDYIYVTTGSLAYEQLKVISEEVGTERTLLICCKAFMTEGADFPNLTLVKIPRAILSKCEWDQDDYSFTLNVLSDSEQPDDIDYDEDTEGEEQL